jgi:putative protein-disulfide isomerase
MPTAFYVADPMCSWCWGFAPVLEKASQALPADVPLRYVMGGLAPDSDELMPAETRTYVQNAWREVEQAAGVGFNWDYWEKCRPRRSTYPACRAALAAGLQNAMPQMFSALQQAYYLQARNPSDSDTHIELAQELGLDVDRFGHDLESPQVQQLLEEDFMQRRLLQVREFPSLLLEKDQRYYWIMRGWAPAEEVLKRLDELLTDL